ncbi:thioredoxin domain-containing protein [Quatrionicoccus australiensis]|uniref:hypothetical protein n=1 Tax=Quatrionicoccus australiensis TaxID=138118 RepID=UPI001CF9EEEF|nr:hypothetical protein [Quatrionicoccus australiensis]MCB4359029.1 hypothetical protein [Quatrionicoccus australiensis]
MKTDRTPLRRLLPAALLALPALVFAQNNALTVASDLRAEAAQAARYGGPLIIMYSRADCRFCEAIRRDYLKPLTDDPRHKARLLVRQINQDSDAPLTGFRGEATTHARLAASEKIKLVPVVAFYGPNGQRLAEPIIGTRLPDFYQGYLDDAIEQSHQALKKP